MKRKGFTLVELLVVIAVIALLMGLLMPALARVRQIAHRLICGANQSGVGKSMLLYAQDHDEEFPKGGIGTTWERNGRIMDAFAMTRLEAYGRSGRATVTGALYLLVKTTEASTKLFTCAGDEGIREFTLDEVTGVLPQHIEDVTDAWDFGHDKMYGTLLPGQYNSYAYQLPYDEDTELRGFPVSPTSNPETPVLADRNPFLDRNSVTYLTDTDLEDAKWVSDTGYEFYSDEDKKENSATHQREGQNVLFADGHIRHERFPNCGIRSDNIWKYWPGERLVRPEEEEDWQVGTTDSEPQKNGDYGPKAEDDAYLVSEVNCQKSDKWGRKG
ncbi:MAG: type II secretion system protein [Planctomycetota bacterium]|jgi:prepilin-type N-terminal cleavage/methylation domain-containing protein/prepilin-type processing-associated H-X9-DG protein